jgi:hypothetical protein
VPASAVNGDKPSKKRLITDYRAQKSAERTRRKPSIPCN